MKERDIFDAALAIPDPEKRGVFLAAACAGDTGLEQHLRNLLAAERGLGSFLEEPAAAPTLTMAPPRVAEGVGTVIGPYKLLEPIGEGGMGTVYMAEQTHPVRRKVALKVIKPGMDTKQVIARFEAERQALAMMDHPNIAKVLDAGTTESGHPYFVMELVRGIPITDYCDREHLPIPERLDLFVLVCRAVQHAHQKGVIHRDIKPTNVLITLHDGVPVPKVIDFGIAKATGQTLTDRTLYTGFGQLVGTPLYMSPEQAEMSGLDVDTRSDVYSLGVLLYELLTGTTPFDQGTMRRAALDEMRRIIREEEPPKPSTRLSSLGATLKTVSANRKLDPRHLGRTVRGELDWIVMRALEKDRKRRYETANDFAADVMRFLTDRPVEACPPSSWYRVQKFVSRNRRGLATSVLLAVGVLTVAGVLGALSLQKAGRIRRLTQDVRQALEGARTAVDAGDLSMAGQWAAEAQGRIGADGAAVPSLAREVDGVRRGVEARKADDARFRQFHEGASDAQDRMGYDRGLGGDLVAEETLALYGVLTEKDWLSRLERSYLTAGQKQQVRESAYVTLVSLADFLVRWNAKEPGSVTHSLDLLGRAEAFHDPTRAFYFVRSECRRQQGDTAAADEDVARFRAAKAQSAWDYFLPGHTAGWRGDLDEAIRSYQAALALQPNHYNSLFFLAMRLGTDKINRPAEAIAYFTGCIALRPGYIYAYANRGELQQKLGRTGAAEADYTAAIAAASNDKDRAHAYRERRRFFERLGRAEEARSDETRAIELLERTWAGRGTMPGVSDAETYQAMNALAVAYVEVGRYRDAILLLEQGLQAHKARFGPDDRESLTAMHNLGAAYFEAGRSREAIPLLETTLESWESKLGIDHTDTLKCRNMLGSAYDAAGRTAEAIRLLEVNLRLTESKNGPDHADTLWARNNLAEAYRVAGRTAEAIRLNESNLKLRESRLGPGHPDTLTTRNNLALAYFAAGRTAEAIRLDEATLKGMESALGPDHPNTLASRNNLAADYRAAGRTSEAIPLFEANLKLEETKLGPDHPRTLTSRSNLASAYNATGRTAEAIALGESTLKLQDSKLGPDHPDTIETRSGLAYAYYTVGRTAEAIPMFEAALRQRESKLGPDHPDTLASRHNLAGIYNAAGRTAEAIRLHEATLKRKESKLGPDHPGTLASRHNLAVAYDAVGRTTEAIAQFEQTLRGRDRKLGPDHPATLDTILNLAHVLKSQRPGEAERLLRRALEGHRKLQVGSPALASTLAELGLHLLKRERWAEAEPLLRECLAVREKAMPDDWRRFNSMSLLGGALLGQGRFAEAEPLVVGGYEGMSARRAKIPPQGEVRLSEAGTRVVQLYEAWGKPGKAADWRRRLTPMLPDLPADVFAPPSPR